MKMGKTYIVPHKRRRKQKTDYRLRLALIKSHKPRFVVRRTTNNTTCQIINYDSKGDKIVVSVNSLSIKKLGWKGHCGNLSSAYLIGLLCGTEAKKKKINEAVLDIGLQSSKSSRLFAALKGAIDADLNIPHSEEIIPKEERIKGSSEKNFEEVKKNIIGNKNISKETKDKKSEK